MTPAHHSFCIEVATSASLAKFLDAQIQVLSRWKSNAFQRYIRLPPHKLAKLSKTIVPVNLQGSKDQGGTSL